MDLNPGIPPKCFDLLYISAKQAVFRFWQDRENLKPTKLLSSPMAYLLLSIPFNRESYTAFLQFKIASIFSWAQSSTRRSVST